MTEFYQEPGVILAIVGLVGGAIYFMLNAKSKKGEITLDNTQYTEDLARKLKKEGIDLAEKLESAQTKLATETRLAVESYVNRSIKDTATDYDHKFALVKDQFDLSNERYSNHVREFRDTVRRIVDELREMKKENSLLKQMTYGISTKSTPPFMEGLDETAEHSDEEGKGIYRDTEEEASDRLKNDKAFKKYIERDDDDDDDANGYQGEETSK